jgi:PilZ domain
LLVQLDPVLLPLAIDEIGFAEDASCAMVLLRMAEGNWPHPTRAFARLKAVEALGRLKPQLAVELLRKFAEARNMFQWAYPSELRLVAAQSLSKMDRLWAREFLPRSGFSAAELTLSTLDSKPDSKWLRRRRYPRVRLVRPMPAMAAVRQYRYRLEIRGLSLSGGVAAAEKQLQPGALASLRIGSGSNPICAYVLMRDARSQGFGFEIADMELEERARLRQLLLENAYPDAPDRQKVPTSPSV